MSQITDERVHWTTADLELLPESSNRYEIIDENCLWLVTTLETSKSGITTGLDATGHLTLAPELIVEVLSPGTQNERRDREAKLKLYTERGVQEYWVLDWQVR